MSQASMQASLSPASWIPCIKTMHAAYPEIWNLKVDNLENDDLENDKILNIIGSLIAKVGFLVQPLIITNDAFVYHAFAITKGFGWLDVITIKIYLLEDNKIIKDGMIKIVAKSESTGVVPLMIPFSPILNIFLCWVPFLDMGNNKRYLKKIKNIIQSRMSKL